MQENVGRIDRIVRFLVGPALAGVGYTRLGGSRGNPIGLAAMLAGTLLVDSAVTRVCPMNALLHLDTRSKRERIRDLRAVVEKQRDLFVEVPVSLDESVTTWTTPP